jgi:hypothetical protein
MRMRRKRGIDRAVAAFYLVAAVDIQRRTVSLGEVGERNTFANERIVASKKR